MIRQWTELKLKPQTPILKQYHWDERGFALEFYDIVDNRFIHISFSTDVDGVQIIFLPNNLESEDRVWALMKEANIPDGPFVPFFVQDQSKFITEVIQMAGYDSENKKYMHYSMILDDFWINVVSALPPRITILLKSRPY